MDKGLLSLKWNNHKTTFFHVLKNARKKDMYCDVSLACEGKFYQAHKLILSSCSDYFEQMFRETQCKHPVIVLKDIGSEELESLLDYMYIGEVNVVQDNLAALIKAAECLRIKGLAVPDEEPSASTPISREKRTIDNSVSSEAKRRKPEETYSKGSSNNSNCNQSNEKRKINNRNNFQKNDGDSSSRNLSQMFDVKTEDLDSSTVASIVEPHEPVKQEPADQEAVYLSDSNSATDTKELLMDNYGDNQQNVLDALIEQNSGSNPGQMREYVDTGDGSGTSGIRDQQHMDDGQTSNFWWTQASSSSTAAVTIAPIDPTNQEGIPASSILPFDEIVDQNKIDEMVMKYICPVCLRKFCGRNDFRKHYTRHTGEKPYPCPHCPHRSSRSDHLRMHIMKRHAHLL